MPISRRKINKKKPEDKAIVTGNGVVLETCYCRKCCLQKKPTDFFSAVDAYLDTNGKMSICKKCINTMYEKFYASERSLEKTLYMMCKILNVRYDNSAIIGTIEYLKKNIDKGKDFNNVFGIYKARLNSVSVKNVEDRDIVDDFTFYEPNSPIVANPLPDDDVESVDLKQFWGTNFEYDDYVFLENELAEWKKTHKSDTKAEETLLKELCHKALEIRKAREIGKQTASFIKEFQELMKTANVDPAKTAIAGSGKAQDTFSAFIKTIEENEPAEFYKDKELFKDIDNIDWYFRKYVTRPLRNFVTQSRIFSLNDNDDDEDFIEDSDDDDINKIINGDVE